MRTDTTTTTQAVTNRGLEPYRGLFVVEAVQEVVDVVQAIMQLVENIPRVIEPGVMVIDRCRCAYSTNRQHPAGQGTTRSFPDTRHKR